MQISVTLTNTMADAINTAVGAAGVARFYDVGALTNLLKSADLAVTNAFGSATVGAITLNVTTPPESTAAGIAGTCTRLGLYTNTGAAATAFHVMLGVNPTGAPDVTMSNNVIATSDTVQITSLVITVPPGAPDVT